MDRSDLESLLPEVFRFASRREGDPLLRGLLDVMLALVRPREDALGSVPEHLDPLRCPPSFVPFLARWVDLHGLLEERPGRGDAGPSLSTGSGRLRELVARAAEIVQRRGTAAGLVLALEIATGESGFEVEETVRDGEGRIVPFHVRIHAPPSTRPHRALVRRLIEAGKPAYVTYEMEFGSTGPTAG
jgi:phage tail-like protein